MSLQEVHQFFGRYQAAFNALDGDAVADLWCSASGIADTAPSAAVGRLTWWSDDAPMRENMRALCDVYRRNGFARCEWQVQDHVDLGANHSFANLHWTLRRTDGSVLQQFHTAYQLMRTDAGPKVLMATAYEEDITRMKRDAAA
jgi:hypothetical protein